MQILHSLHYTDLRTGKKGTGKTVVIETKFAQDDFDALVGLFLNPPSSMDKTMTVLNMRMGVAVCHPKDQFNKKAGRELATSRITNQNFKVTHVVSNSEKTKIILQGQDSKVDLTMVKYKNTGKVRIFLKGMFDILGG